MKNTSKLLLLALWAISCQSAPDQAYLDAIEDAKDAYPDEVRPLTPLVPSSKNTTWKDGKVLMASLIPEWAANQFYFPALKAGGAFTTPTIPGVFMWTTAVPQLKNFMRQYKEKRDASTDPDILPRVEMLLGLPVKAGAFFIAQFWVSPEHIFRPCPNPEIDDKACEADERRDNPSFNVFDKVKTTKEHQDWYNAEKKNKYTGANPFPWTRLGYTYDYDKKEKSHDSTGLSEFVLKPGVPITIESISAFDQY